MASQVYMVYHPGGVASNVVSIQSGSDQLCSETLERWQQKEGSDVYELGRFYSREDADTFIAENGYRMM